MNFVNFLLHHLNIIGDFNVTNELIAMNPINYLQEYCQKTQLMMPQYDLIDDKVFSNSHLFTMRVTIGSLNADGVANNKKGAKYRAAENMITLMNLNKNIFSTPCSSSSLYRSPNTSFNSDSSNDSSLINKTNYVGKLQEFCVKYKLKLPIYDWDQNYLSCTGYKLICRIGDLSEEAVAYNKKEAKQACARQMWQTLMKIEKNFENTQQISNENDSINTSQNLIFNKFDELKIMNAPDGIQLSIEKAKLICSSLKKGTFGDPKQVFIEDYHSYLKNSLTPDTLDKLKKYLNKLILNMDLEVKKYEIILKEICLLLNVDFEEQILSVQNGKVAVAYTINTNLSYTGIGVGPSYETAKLNALSDSINTILEVLQ